MTVLRVLALAALVGVVLGFSNTSPVIAWSSTSSITLNLLPSRLQNGTHTLNLVQNIVDTQDICDYDVVMIIEQPGLHASDLRSLSAQSGLSRRVTSSPFAWQYPYVHSHPEFDAPTVARKISSNCRSRFSTSTFTNIATSFEHTSEKHVLAVVMPDLLESGKARKDAMVVYESLLSQELDVLAGKSRNHLVILVGLPLLSVPGFFKRQAPMPSSNIFLVANHTNASLSGFLGQYQVLTPGLITSLLVFFFIIFPIVFCGVKALASIQNPIRMDTTRSSVNALEKKNQ